MGMKGCCLYMQYEPYWRERSERLSVGLCRTRQMVVKKWLVGGEEK